MRFFDKHFGKLASLMILLVVFIVNSIGYNLSNIKLYESFNSYIFTALILLFFLALFYFYNKFKIGFKTALVLLLFNLQALFVTKFLSSVELGNKDLSMIERNNAIGMSWIIIIPILVILFLLIGWLFDIIVKKSMRTPN